MRKPIKRVSGKPRPIQIASIQILEILNLGTATCASVLLSDIATIAESISSRSNGRTTNCFAAAAFLKREKYKPQWIT